MPDSPRIEELKRRVQLDAASIAFAALAEEYRRTGRYEEAIDVCRTGLQRHPSYISAHVTLGRALFEVGQYDDARKELEYVLSVAPENLAAIRGLAEIHHRQGQSSDSPDLTATEMADMLAVPHPAAPLRVEAWKPPPPLEPVVETFQPSAPAMEEPSPESSSPVMETVPLEAMPPVFDTPVLEPEPPPEPEPQLEPEPEPEPFVIHAVEPEPSPVDLPIEAIVTPFEAPADDPALERLETFLHAIHRARESAGGIHAS